MKRFFKGIFVIMFLISVYFISMFVGTGQILHEKIHFLYKMVKSDVHFFHKEKDLIICMKRFFKGIFVIVFLISVNFFSMFVGPGQILHEKIHFCIKKWKKNKFY